MSESEPEVLEAAELLKAVPIPIGAEKKWAVAAYPLLSDSQLVELQRKRKILLSYHF